LPKTQRSVYYDANLIAAAKAWAQNVFFSPLKDQGSFTDADALAAPEYPELPRQQPCRTNTASAKPFMRPLSKGKHLWLSARPLLYSLNDINDLNDELHPMPRHPRRARRDAPAKWCQGICKRRCSPQSDILWARTIIRFS